nr:acyltransferase [Bacteroides sp.]
MTKQYFDKSSRLNDVVIIRSIAIVMVVAFHAYYMMMVPGHFPKSMDMYHQMYYNINCLILQFRMPLFIMISGYLFSHLENDKGKYATFKALLQNKFKRLILPFFVFATVFMLSINDFSWEPYYRWGYQHLWFIPMLFWCFIFTRLQSFLPFNKSTWWKATILTVFFCFDILPHISVPFFALPNFLRWYFWFYFGYQIYLNRDKLYGVMNNHRYIYSFILLSIFICGSWVKCNYLESNTIHTWYTELANISVAILFWFWINFILFRFISADGGVIRKFNWLNKHSYGIYVFHNWLQPFLISSTAIGLFGLETLAMNYPILFPLVFFISSFILSLGLTWLLLKTRVGRFLIG